jgi:ATP-binding cassette subfamily B multidrug efflux pump
MLKLFKNLSKKELGMVVLSIAFVVVQVWLDLKMPDYMSQITMLVETQGSEIGEILKNGAYMLLCAVGSMAASMITGFFAALVAAGLSKKLREKVFKKVMAFNDEEMGRFSTASLITRTTNDITQIQTIIAMGLQAIIKAPILLVWAIIKISGKQWEWSAATACAVLVIMVMILITIIFAMPKFKIIQKLTDNLNRVTRENLIGIRVVRAYNAEGFQEAKFDKANSELTGANLYANRVMALIMPSMSLVISGISLAIYWIGAYIINDAGMMDRFSIFSDMVVFSSYAIQVIMAFAMLTMLFIMLPRVLVSAKRINEVLDTKVRMENGTEKGNTECAGTVEFKNVSFRYPDAGDDVISDISFKAEKGETVAVIGATASGKSSLINLIPRLYDAVSGEVLVDGVDVKKYDIKSLREKIGFVAQKAILFSGTVNSNVSYAAKENESAAETADLVNEAIDIAQAGEFVDRMPDKKASVIAQGGTNVSGGQKQRLSIARAVYKKPEIYVFDDSFSALDYSTDKALRNALAEKTKDATKIIVAQRIGTIKDADSIIVLEDGKIAGIGKHAQLMKECDAYREIALSQLSQAELEKA